MGARVDLQTDVVIVGAGPAGLAAAAGLRATGLSCVVVDQGPPLHQRNSEIPTHLTSGIGGAGLFSDGKFSFHPSASRLWMLQPEQDLRSAYADVVEVLAESGLIAPHFPDADANANVSLANTVGDLFHLKPYASFYLSVDQRAALTARLAGTVDGSGLLPLTKARLVRENPDGTFTVDLVHTDHSPVADSRISARCRALVLAGGRFGPLSCAIHIENFPYIFQRLEIGIRIEQPEQAFFLRDQSTLDPKLLWSHRSGRYSWRTFCCCRNGRVVSTNFDGWRTLSGRADCPPTSRSNVGFNVRVSDEREARKIWQEASKMIKNSEPSPWGFLRDILGSTASGDFLRDHLGSRGSELLSEGLGRMRETVGDRLLRDSRILGPTVEGVGRYPRTLGALRVGPRPIWVAGDMTGLFRGITAALVSGFFTARQLIRYFRSNE